MKVKALDLEQLHSKDPKIKYGFAKELLRMGAQSPEKLYNYLDYWVNLLQSENQILKWTAIDILGYLSAVDKKNRVDAVIEDLIDFLHAGHLITCNHAIFALGLIAQNKPSHLARILGELLTIRDDKFDSEDCKDIATGKVLEALKKFPAGIMDNHEVMTFIKQAQDCSWSATKKKADKLLARWEKSRKAKSTSV